MLGGTVYTFSIILAVFLLAWARQQHRLRARRASSRRPRVALGWCQFLLAAAIAWTAFMICALAAVLAGRSVYLVTNPWNNFQLDLMRCFWAIFPATCLWGASFPLALAAVASNGADPGRSWPGCMPPTRSAPSSARFVASLLLVRIWHAACPAGPDRRLGIRGSFCLHSRCTFPVDARPHDIKRHDRSLARYSADWAFWRLCSAAWPCSGRFPKLPGN